MLTDKKTWNKMCKEGWTITDKIDGYLDTTKQLGEKDMIVSAKDIGDRIDSMILKELGY